MTAENQKEISRLRKIEMSPWMDYAKLRQYLCGSIVKDRPAADGIVGGARQDVKRNKFSRLGLAAPTGLRWLTTGKRTRLASAAGG